MKLELDQQKMEYILNALAARPFGEVQQLIMEIQHQLQEQLNPPEED